MVVPFDDTGFQSDNPAPRSLLLRGLKREKRQKTVSLLPDSVRFDSSEKEIAQILR